MSLKKLFFWGYGTISTPTSDELDEDSPLLQRLHTVSRVKVTLQLEWQRVWVRTSCYSQPVLTAANNKLTLRKCYLRL